MGAGLAIDGWRDQLLICFAIYRRTLHANCLNRLPKKLGFLVLGFPDLLIHDLTTNVYFEPKFPFTSSVATL